MSCSTGILGIPIFLLAMYLTFIVTINVGGIHRFSISSPPPFSWTGSGSFCIHRFCGWLTVALATRRRGGIRPSPPSFRGGRSSSSASVFWRFRGTCPRPPCHGPVHAEHELPGEAFVPVLVGLGCNVPAIMATRTLESQRDRTLWVVMDPLMSWGRDLPVYALFAAPFSRWGRGPGLWLYLIGIGFAVLTGIVLKNTLLEGGDQPPSHRAPPLPSSYGGGVFLRPRERLRDFSCSGGEGDPAVVMILSFVDSPRNRQLLRK